MSTDLTTIAALHKSCIRSFTDLNTLLGNDIMKVHYQPASLGSLGKFRIWAEGMGAHRKGRVSLDHRLSEASYMKVAVVNLLKELIESLQEGLI